MREISQWHGYDMWSVDGGKDRLSERSEIEEKKSTQHPAQQ